MGNTHWLLQTGCINITCVKEITSDTVYKNFEEDMRWCDFSQAVFTATKWHAHVERWTQTGVTLFMPCLWHSCVNQIRRASTEVFPKLSSTFPDLQCFLTLRDPKSLSTQEALRSRFGSWWRYSRSTSTRRPRAVLCDGQLQCPGIEVI